MYAALLLALALAALASARPPHIFFLLADDLGSANVGFPSIVAELRALIAEAQKTVFSPDRGAADAERFCTKVIENGGFVGPFLP